VTMYPRLPVFFDHSIFFLNKTDNADYDLVIIVMITRTTPTTLLLLIQADSRDNGICMVLRHTNLGLPQIISAVD